jgi:hypothetical protein
MDVVGLITPMQLFPLPLEHRLQVGHVIRAGSAHCRHEQSEEQYLWTTLWSIGRQKFCLSHFVFGHETTDQLLLFPLLGWKLTPYVMQKSTTL